MKKAWCLIFATATLVLLAVLPAEADSRRHSRGGGQRFHHSTVRHHKGHLAIVQHHRVVSRPIHHHHRFHHHGFHHHGHFRHGSHFGVRLFVGPGWWGPVYPVYRAPVVIQHAPPVYIQQEVSPEPYYWYYCQSAQAYYPYVQQCPGGWLKVVPPATESAPQ